MQVNNNLNSMIQLEKKLEESAKALAKLNQNNPETKNDVSVKIDNNEKEVKDINIVQEIVKQIEIPIAYTANAEVISTQNSISRTVLDIKV